MFDKKEVKVEKEEVIFHIDTEQKIPDLPSLTNKETIDLKYPLIPPYAYAHIYWDKEAKEIMYAIEEPILDLREKGILILLEEGIRELINITFISVKEGNTLIQFLERNIKVLLTELGISITKETFMKIMYYIYRDFVGLNEIEPLLCDYFIEDIECNGTKFPLYIVHRKYRNLRTNIVFEEVPKLARFVEKVAQKCGKYVSYSNPLLDGSLPDGSLDYNEPFIYKENKIVKISKIGEFIDRHYIINESNTPIKIENIEVPAFDPKTLKIIWRKVDYAYRHKINEDIFEVNLEFGRKVRLTGCHSLFVLTKNGVESRRTDELTEKDYAIIPLIIPENDVIKEINVIEEISKTKYAKKFVLDNVPEHIYLEKKQEIKNYLNKNYKHPHQAYYEMKDKRILPIYLYNILEEDILRKCKIRSTSAVGIPTFLKVDENLMKFLGLYIAEGWLYNNASHASGVYFSLNKKEKDLINTLNKSAKECFGLDIYAEPEDKNAVKIKISSYALWVLLNEIIKISKGAKDKRIPELVLNVNKKLQQEFLKYWNLGDYGSSASKYLANDISYLSLFNKDVATFYDREKVALFEGIRKVKSHEYYTNFFVRDCFNPYSSMIPTLLFNPLKETHNIFRNKKVNRERLRSVLNNIKYQRFKNLGNVDSIKFIKRWSKRGFINEGKLSDKGNELLKEIEVVNKLIDSDLGFAKINSIKKVKSSGGFVYDVSVKDCENFVGGYGGICCHNSRVQATYTVDITSRGPSFSIRKFTKEPWSPTKYIQMRTASPELLAYLWMLIEHEFNVMVIGGTGSGKTSLLNALAFFIPPQARIVSIEDTRELNLEHDNWLPSVAREGIGLANIVGQKYGEVSLFDLLKESFRQNPDYVIVGEVRGAEAYVLFQGMASIPGNQKVMILDNGNPRLIEIDKIKNIKNCKTISYTTKKGEAKLLPIVAHMKHPKRSKLIRIKTKTGREVITTPDHSLFTLSLNGLIDIPASDLKIGNKLAIASKIPCGYMDLKKLNLIDIIPNIRIYAPEKIKEASQRLGYYQASKVCGIASISDYYSNFKRANPSSMSKDKFFSLIKRADLKVDNSNLQVKLLRKSRPISAEIEITDEFLRLLGYYISEGTINFSGKNSSLALYNKNEIILEDMKHCINKVTNAFIRERTTYGFGTATELKIGNKIYTELLALLCGRGKNKKIPEFIFGLSKERIGQFLSGLFTGDGYITHQSCGYTTVLKELAQQVQQLLLVYGIVASLYNNKSKCTYETRFYREEDKEEFVKYVKLLGRKEFLRKTKTENKNKFNEVYLDTIKELEIINLDEAISVYDLCVPGPQNFLSSNGVILHNSGHPSFGTMHADDVKTLIRRLETPPINLSPALVESMDAVCVMSHVKVKGLPVRRIREVVEVVSVKDELGEAVTNQMFAWNPATDNFSANQKSNVFTKLAQQAGLPIDQLYKELKLRAQLLAKMTQANIFEFRQVQKIINEYNTNQAAVLQRFNVK